MSLGEIQGADNGPLIGLAYMARCMLNDIEGQIEQKRISTETIISLLP